MKSKIESVVLSVHIIIIRAENTVPTIAGGFLTSRAAEASRMLFVICFSEIGRDNAISARAVEELVSFLSRLQELSGNTIGETKMNTSIPNVISEAKLSTLNALAALTASDEAKLRFLPCDQGLDVLCSQLNICETAIQLAALKVISNIATYPTTRLKLRQVKCITVSFELLHTSRIYFLFGCLYRILTI